MNPTLALFWKEGREAAYKIAACAGLAMIAGLWCNLWEYPQRSILGADTGTVGHLAHWSGADGDGCNRAGAQPNDAAVSVVSAR